MYLREALVLILWWVLFVTVVRGVFEVVITREALAFFVLALASWAGFVARLSDRWRSYVNRRSRTIFHGIVGGAVLPLRLTLRLMRLPRATVVASLSFGLPRVRGA